MSSLEKRYCKMVINSSIRAKNSATQSPARAQRFREISGTVTHGPHAGNVSSDYFCTPDPANKKRHEPLGRRRARKRRACLELACWHTWP